MKALKHLVAVIGLLLISVPVMAVYLSEDEDLQSLKLRIDSGQIESVVKELEELSYLDPSSADIYSLLGYARRKNGHFSQALQAYNRALTLDPQHRGALAYQGELFLLTSEHSKAAINLQRLKLLCPKGCDELRAFQAAWANQ